MLAEIPVVKIDVVSVTQEIVDAFEQLLLQLSQSAFQADTKPIGTDCGNTSEYDIYCTRISIRKSDRVTNSCGEHNVGLGD